MIIAIIEFFSFFDASLFQLRGGGKLAKGGVGCVGGVGGSEEEEEETVDDWPQAPKGEAGGEERKCS